MTQLEYEQRVKEAKKLRIQREKEVWKEYETALAVIRETRHKCKEQAKFIEELRQKYISEAYDAYNATREALDYEYESILAEKRKEGHLSYNDFLEAVKIIYRFLSQANKNCIIIPWGESGTAEILFNITNKPAKEGGEA